MIAGPDEDGERERMAALAAELKIVHRVDFVGHVEGSEKTRWFRDALVFVLPSDDENFGVAVVEAAHVGTPVVVSHHVALAREVVEDGAGLATNQEPSEIADAVLNVIAKQKSAFADGLARFTQRFSWAESARNIVEGYDDAIAKTRR